MVKILAPRLAPVFQFLVNFPEPGLLKSGKKKKLFLKFFDLF